MKNHPILLLVLCCLMAGFLPAQESPDRSLSVSWGVGHLQRQDLTFSPMIHKSWSPLNVMIEYQRSKKMEQSLSVKFGQYEAIIGEPFTYTSFYDGEGMTYAHSFTLVDINYALGKKIVDKDAWSLALGGRLRNRLLPSNYAFANFNSFGYYFSFGLDAYVGLELRPGERHHIVSRLALPLFSFNTRTDYLWHTDEYLWNNYSHQDLDAFVNYIEEAELQSWGQSQSVDFDVQYYYALSERFEVGGRYNLSMNFNQDPTRFSQVENVFYVSGKIKF